MVNPLKLTMAQVVEVLQMIGNEPERPLVEAEACFIAADFINANSDIAPVLDKLENFVRTPEWSVSMLEDIAEIVRLARPHIGPDFKDDDPRAWSSH